MKTPKEKKQELQNFIDDYSLRIESLKNVKILTKKDGTHFTSLPKNFNISSIRFSEVVGYTFTFYYKNKNGYSSFELCTLVVEQNVKEAISLIEAAIKNEIGSYQNEIEKTKQQLEIFDEVVSDFLKSYALALKKVEDKAGKKTPIWYYCYRVQCYSIDAMVKYFNN